MRILLVIVGILFWAVLGYFVLTGGTFNSEPSEQGWTVEELIDVGIMSSTSKEGIYELISCSEKIGIECITAGNCPNMNGDGIVDLVDFSIIAARYE